MSRRGRAGGAVRLRFALEAALFRGLVLVARLLPRRALRVIGTWAGDLGYLLDRRHRRVAIENLELAFGPDLSDRRRSAIARKTWRHFGRVVTDTLAFPRFGPESAGRDVLYEGLEHIREAYERGRGVLLFSGHFGHWELVALMQGHLDLPLALVTRPLDNPALERSLARFRGMSGNEIVHKRNAAREMLRVLRKGRGVAIVIDQDARENGVFVPFFGRLASTTPSLATLALRTDAAVIPVFSIPLPDGRYRVVYERPVTFERTDDRDRDIVALTARCTAIIERWVRTRPDLWLWMHRRWKTRPPEHDREPAGTARSSGDDLVE